MKPQIGSMVRAYTPQGQAIDAVVTGYEWPAGAREITTLRLDNGKLAIFPDNVEVIWPKEEQSG